ncbi:MAG: glycosyltransferase family 9 protein [Alphaproteobacteria bacterium]
MNSAPKNILVIQPLPGIGDLFWFDAVLQSLSSFYKTPVTLLTKRQSQAQALYGGNNYVQDVLWIERPGLHEGLWGMWRLARTLKQKKFSHVWILHKSWRYRWVCRWAGIQHIMAYPVEKKWLQLHPIQRAEQLLKNNGVPLLKDPLFPISEDARRHVEQILKIHKKPWVALGIGGSEPSKKWGHTYWEDLAVWLSHHKKVSVFLLAGAREHTEAEKMVSSIQKKGGEAVALTQFSLQQSLAFLAETELVIANDTGMMNGAAVLNKPVIGLFLGTAPLRYRSCLKPIQVLPGGKTISVDQVQKAVTMIL